MPIILERTISETFLERVRRTPHAPGYQYKITAAKEVGRSEWQTLTYREFYKECRWISYGLGELGVGSQETVVILSTTRLEWALADMAILGAGGVTVPIYPSNTADDVAYLLNHCEAKIAFVENLEQLQKIEEKRSELPHLRKVIVFDSEQQETGPESEPVISLSTLIRIGSRAASSDPDWFDKNLRSAGPHDLITICYTSGTTGTPKGVMLTHDNLMSVLEDCARVLGEYVRPENETLLTFLPFSHILGKVESMASFTFGWCAAYAENIDRIVENMAEVRPTIMFAVPRVFEKAFARVNSTVETAPQSKRLLFAWAQDVGKRYFNSIWNKKTPPIKDFTQYQIAKRVVFHKILQRFGGRLRFAICGGAPLPKEVGEYFQILGVQALEGYGLTETCAPVAVNTPKAVRFGSVGRPLPDVSIKIAEDGEIQIKSRKVFKGYFKDEEATRETFDGEWLKTGDIGHLDADGFLHVTDRKKDLIVTSGGKNIAPQKIEKMAKSYPMIAHLVVIGDKKNYLVALITLDEPRVLQYARENHILHSEYAELVKNPRIQALIQKMVDELNAKLASYETIKKFVILPRDFSVESGELTPSLKVKRAFVASRYRTEIEAMYS